MTVRFGAGLCYSGADPADMDRREFAHRAETFGFNGQPWALDSLRLLYNVPRAYDPLVRGWEHHHPGTRRSLSRLVKMGFVAHQPPVIMDTRTGTTAHSAGRSVRRYRTTARGRRLLVEAETDIRSLEVAFPRASHRNLGGVLGLLEACDLGGSNAAFGLSQLHAVELSGLPERSGRWWIARLCETGHLRALERKVADTREVIPAHWRVTRLLSRQLTDVIRAFPVPPTLELELRLQRSKYLEDIDPARLGISGATDFDHDVIAQRVLAALLVSPHCVPAGRVLVEPRHFLPLYQSERPWRFDPQGPSTLFYQPDAELRERGRDGVLRRCVVEYERYQSRRDGWHHIERFLGYLHTKTLPVESAILRFVVDSTPRVQSYRELIEAFADWSIDHPQMMPRNPVTLAVSSVEAVLGASDPLDPRHWFTIGVTPPTTNPRVVVHPKSPSPDDEYFSH